MLEQAAHVTPVAVAFAFQAIKHCVQHLMVVVGHIGWRNQKIHDLAGIIDHQMQFEAEKPASRGFAPPGDALKNTVGVNAAVVTNGQLFGINEIQPRMLALERATLQKHIQAGQDFQKRSQKPFIADLVWKTAFQTHLHHVPAIILKTFATRIMVKHADAHQFALTHQWLVPGTSREAFGLALLPAIELFAKIIEGNENPDQFFFLYLR